MLVGVVVGGIVCVGGGVVVGVVGGVDVGIVCVGGGIVGVNPRRFTTSGIFKSSDRDRRPLGYSGSELNNSSFEQLRARARYCKKTLFDLSKLCSVGLLDLN